MMNDMTSIETRKGNWMQTATGKQFWPVDPRPEDVCIEDIAAALSKMCRYAGHCKRFYSVAEHSILVSHYVKLEYALWGLLHDAAEAYVVDIPRPLKPFISNYKELETNVMDAVCDRFSLPRGMPDEVKRVDNAILGDEQKYLMAPPPAEWELLEPPLGLKGILGMSPAVAETLFLERFRYLTAN